MVASSLSSLAVEEGTGDKRELSDPVVAKRGLSGEMGTGLDLVDSRRMERRSRANTGRGRDDLGIGITAGR
jgi:hypothetical protein